jgi:hypothetical protein
MKHLKANWSLRTDGRTVSDDLEDFRNSEAGKKFKEQLRLEILGITDHGDENFYTKGHAGHPGHQPPD